METNADFERDLFNIARIGHQLLQAVAEKVAPYLEKAAPLLAALAQIDWAVVKQRLDELPQKSKGAMRVALAEGWFFGWHDGLESCMGLVENLGTAQAATVDDVMVAYYRTNLSPFTDELTSRSPDWAPAIKAAVHAHKSLGDEGYFLSIPVFIAQADGLLAEITGVESPMTKAAKVLREKYADDPELLDLLCPFLELQNSDFMMSAKARQGAAQASGKSFTALNRHQVMHGERSDYGTEINSLKAFSFLVFAGLHVPVVLERQAASGSVESGLPSMQSAASNRA
jgi:hypothetical protein